MLILSKKEQYDEYITTYEKCRGILMTRTEEFQSKVQLAIADAEIESRKVHGPTEISSMALVISMLSFFVSTYKDSPYSLGIIEAVIVVLVLLIILIVLYNTTELMRSIIHKHAIEDAFMDIREESRD